ncbi:hypothetical protein [Nocardia carnea]|uniref:hypothetical protein n=1 Tax=Nocardia carnea TaxID=37328 RepID=UPI0024537CFD|nr:hypothetical protein [Nocardia carnea]
MTALDGAFNNDGRFQQFFTSAAHLMLPAIALQAASRIPYYLGVDHLLISVAGLVANVLVVVGLLHNEVARLCVRCMQEVPADAGTRAQRQQWVLWTHHFVKSGRGLALLGSALVAYWVFAYSDLPRISQAPSDLVFTLLFYSIWLHHRLRPWCPYCRDWGSDGMKEPSPDPVVKATL